MSRDGQSAEPDLPAGVSSRPEGKILPILASLNGKEKRELLAALLADKEAAAALPGKPLPAAELARAADWLWERVESAGAPSHKNSRLRTWFIFSLLRFGGLRLPEIFRLAPGDLDLDAGLALVREGKAPRITPLPLSVAAKMKEAWALWREPAISETPFLCDAGRLRRSFKECEKALGLPDGLINARSMRRLRGREMELRGIGTDLVEIFMGRETLADDRERNRAARLLKGLIQGSGKTSARNVFPCVATGLEERGIIVRVFLATTQGLKIEAVITGTSRAALDLAPGSRVRALVKAPWVGVYPPDEAPAGANIFYGTVSRVQRDAEACEIIVILPEGPTLCALYHGEKLESRRFAAGDAVAVRFDPFAVILVAD